MPECRIIVVLLLCVCSSALGQINFEKGYIIDHKGNKTECLIENTDWGSVPKSINYKSDETAASTRIETEDLQEFSVGRSKHLWAKVRYDKSEQELKKLSTSRLPDWTEGNLFLKVLVEGKATLYYYHPTAPNDFNLFFYSIDGGEIKQLEFKNYLTNRDPTTDPGETGPQATSMLLMASNYTYINQLNLDVKCQKSRPANQKYLPYKLTPLVSHFAKFNECVGATYVDKTKSDQRLTHLKLTVGADFNYTSWDYVASSDFPKAINPRFGVEVETVLPFGSNKWAVFLEAASQTYNGELTSTFSSTRKHYMTYRALELNLGVRHYFHINKQIRLYLSLGAAGDIPFKFEARTENPPTFGNPPFSPTHFPSSKIGINLFASAGLAIQRFTLEFRPYTQRVYRTDTYSYELTYNKNSIIMGYRLF